MPSSTIYPRSRKCKLFCNVLDCLSHLQDLFLTHLQYLLVLCPVSQPVSLLMFSHLFVLPVATSPFLYIASSHLSSLVCNCPKGKRNILFVLFRSPVYLDMECRSECLHREPRYQSFFRPSRTHPRVVFPNPPPTCTHRLTQDYNSWFKGISQSPRAMVTCDIATRGSNPASPPFAQDLLRGFCVPSSVNTYVT
jgi:hypothetical protein